MLRRLFYCRRTDAPRKRFPELVYCRSCALQLIPKIQERKSEGAMAHQVAAASACLNSEGQWSTVLIQVSGAPESQRSVGVEKTYGLVVGLERLYKVKEEIREGQRRLMEEKSNSSKLSLPPNQRLEGTPPCFALRRPSAAR